MNDADRSEWVDNDEGLYRWWLGSRQPKREFVRQNRSELDTHINKILNPKTEKTWRDYVCK